MPEPLEGIKRGDTFTPFKATLEKYNKAASKWEPVDLTEASTVTLYLRSTNYPGTVVTGACTFTKGPGGSVEYAWVEGDTALADLYEGECKITWASGKIQTVPNKGYLSYRITPNLKDAE